jgi:DNA-binding winged helix-turn-helix (wHTH) protein
MRHELGTSHATTEAWCCPTCGGPMDAELSGVLFGVKGVTYNGLSCRLSYRQLEVLRCLARRFRQPVHSTKIYETVWGDTDTQHKIVDVMVCKLRPALAPIGLGIETFHGVGFALKPLAEVPARKMRNGRTYFSPAVERNEVCRSA